MARTNAWKLGVFVISGWSLSFVALVWLGADKLHRDSKRAVTYFDESVQGLEIGSPVKFRGVTIGTVAGITVAPDKRHVEVSVDVYTEVLVRLGLRKEGETLAPGASFVPENLRVQLASAGLTGIKFLQLDFFDIQLHPRPDLPFPEPDNYVPAAESTLKSLEEVATTSLSRLPPLLDRIKSLAERLDGTLVEVDAPGLSRRTQTLLGTVDEKLRGVDVAALASRVESTLIEAQGALAATRRLAETVQADDGRVMRLVKHLDAVAGALEAAVNDAQPGPTAGSLRETSGAFGQAAREVQVLGEDLRGAMTALREAAEAFRRLSELLQRDPAALLHGRQPPEPPGR